MDLKKLDNEALVGDLKILVGQERKVLNEILEYLSEVEFRKLYLKRAYPSLFEFCVKELGYSKAAAFRRIEAMRLLKTLPWESQNEIKSQIEAGSLNLTHLTQAQSFFKAERKENKTYSTAQKIDLVKKIENTSKLETEKILAEISPKSAPIQTVHVRVINESNLEIRVRVSKELWEKIQKLKARKSHTVSNLEGLLENLVNAELKRVGDDEIAKNGTVPPAELKTREERTKIIQKEEWKMIMGFSRSRYIPTSIRKQVWQRDGGKCSYVDPQSRKRCEADYFLQIDHIHPFAKGGLSTNPQNLRILCANHNQNRD